jgi:putative transposase
MRYPLVRDLAAEGVAVAVTCRVLGFSKQGYFKWRRRPVCPRDLENAYLTNAAVDVNHDDPAFGYRFIADETHPERVRPSLDLPTRTSARIGPGPVIGDPSGW